MTRKLMTTVVTLSAAFVLMTGCASKKPGATGASDGSGDSTGGVTESSATGSSSAGSSGAGAGLTTPTVYFDFNSYTISPDDRNKLQNAADQLQANKDVQVTIEGHCDERGSSEYNLALGERRALAVKSYLQKLGVDGKRLATLSYGEERPAVQGATEEAWAKNRRGEVIVNR